MLTIRIQLQLLHAKVLLQPKTRKNLHEIPKVNKIRPLTAHKYRQNTLQKSIYKQKSVSYFCLVVM